MTDVRVDQQTGVEWVWMHHPSTNGEAEVTKASFEQEDGWKGKGWELGRAEHPVASTAAAGGAAATIEVPDGTVDEVLAWVGNDHGRAQQALDAEQTYAYPRSTVVDHLEELLTGEVA